MKSSKLYSVINFVSFFIMITLLVFDEPIIAFEKWVFGTAIILFLVSGFQSLFRNNLWFQRDKQKHTFSYKQYSYLASALLIIIVGAEIVDDLKLLPSSFDLLQWISFSCVYLALFIHQLASVFDKENGTVA